MTAHDQMRAMLDQLMGTSRNGIDENLSIKFDDPSVCKSFLMSCCPHEILASTRMDLGDCAKFHNVALRADYESAAQTKDYFYDLEALEQLRLFVADADRKTEQARKRLADTQEEYSGDTAGKAEKVHEVAEKIGQALAKAEQLGAEGLVEESMALMGDIDELRKEKSSAEADYRGSIPAAAYQQQKLRVCDVCCAYLGINDNDRRLADHFGGKLHLGFIKIRDTLKEFEVKADERHRLRRETYRNRSPRREVDNERGTDRRREFDNEREPERRREVDNERDTERRRERDRGNRGERDRDRERGHRGNRGRRSRSGDRNRERSRKSRSRSRDHKPRDSRKSESDSKCKSPYQ